MNDTKAGNGVARRSIYSAALLILVVAIVFVVPVLPQASHKIVYNILFTIIFLVAAMSMDRGRGIIIGIAFGSIVIEWIAVIFDMPVLLSLSRVVAFLFFIVIVIGLIIQIALTKRVTARVIIESISGYLLLGLVFMLIVTVIMIDHPDAFTFPKASIDHGSNTYSLSEYMYFSFVSFTTLGYGDVVPKTPYAKSLAMLAAVCGQIYLTVIIAMLVGKFLSHSREVS